MVLACISKLLKLFDLFDNRPTCWDFGVEYDSDSKASPCDTSSFWADMYGGEEKLVELMYASIDEYYGGCLACHSEGGKPRIGFVSEYYPNRFWRDEYYSDSD